MANLNKEKKYHYIYKTTNLINGKFYVGMHSTNNLNDGYLGSGYKLRRSINKNGKENFKIEILEFFSDRNSLVEREKQLVNEKLLKDPMCMNLVFGGNGGFISVDGYKKGAKRMNEVIWSNSLWIDKRKKELREYQLKTPTGVAASHHHRYDWNGKKHKEETKAKIGLANSVKQMGKNNCQYGTRWITNGIENKKIKKLDSIPIGWQFGRTM